MDPQILRDQLDELGAHLQTQEPNPARTDWIAQARILDEVTRGCEWLLDNHHHIDSTSESADTAQRVRNYLVDRCSAGAALLNAGLRVEQAQSILQRCAEICPDPTDQALYAAGLQDLDAFSQVIHASWLFQHERQADARRVAETLRAAPPAIAEFARTIERAPIPVDSAPVSFSLNGFGLRFYGGYDRDDNGSEVRVRFVTALFIPVIPIDAYRMRDVSDETYAIHGKVKLGPIMRVWQIAALGLVAVALTWALVSSFLNSHERRLGREIDEVATLERRDPEAALARYESLATTYIPLLDGDGEDELLRVAEGWVRVATASVPEPITPAGVDQVASIVARYSVLPGRMHEDPLTDPFVDRLLRWVDALGSETSAAGAARLELLLVADRFASASRRARVDEGIRSTRLALAQQLAVDWPLEALRQYARMPGDQAAGAAMDRLLAELPREPTLLVEVGDEIKTWARANPRDQELAQELTTLVAQAEALNEDPERQTLLQGGDEPALRAALELNPYDQGLAVALAAVHRSRGELDEAAALLDAFGTPGLMTHDAQYLHASMAFERGDQAGAAGLLEQMLGNRLPAFEDARRAYDTEVTGLQDRLIRRAEQGDIPTQYSQVTSDDVDKAREAFGDWLQAEVEKSLVLPQLQAAYMRQSDIVPVAILLGTVQLQRARATIGEERQRLLDSAETSFLSIRGEAGGMPSYHMALAQVYHRLGKTAEGDAEFQILIDDPDPATQLHAVQGYRDLNQFERARQISEAIYASAQSPYKQQAAMLRSLLAHDLDDRQTWLERSDQSDEFVTTALLELAGDRLARDGEFAAADAKYEQAYNLYAARAERENGSYNNAALALLSRHTCTGDLRHVDAAVELMKKSVAISPDNAIVIGNYANTLDFQANLELLDTFIPTRGLRIGASETNTLLDALHESSLHDEFVAAIRKAPGHSRALEVWGQFEALAPQGAVAYASQASRHNLAESDEAMVKLVTRLHNVEGFDTSDGARAYTERLSGEFDEQTIADLSTDLRGRAAVREQTKRASKATRAALLHLDGVDLYARARLHGLSDEGLADAQAAVVALEQAQALWPEGLGWGALTDALILLAIYETATEDAELSAYWSEHQRVKGTAMTLHGLLARGSSMNALIDNAAFERSIELRRIKPDAALGLLDFVVAMLASDEALKARAHAVLTGPRNEVLRELRDLLAPYDDQSEVHALLEAEAG